jgi:outer membrane protein OmpA-like peptidoglycan-associated protein
LGVLCLVAFAATPGATAAERTDAPTLLPAQAQGPAVRSRSVEADLAGLKPMQTERGLVITLGDVLFSSNQTALKSGAAGTLEQIAKFMRSHPERRLLIEGHTDARGTEDHNLQLSERRAAAVRDALIERQIDPRRIETIGFGEIYPIGDNDTAAGMQKNRRIEVVISDENGRFVGSAGRETGVEL